MYNFKNKNMLNITILNSKKVQCNNNNNNNNNNKT